MLKEKHEQFSHFISHSIFNKYNLESLHIKNVLNLYLKSNVEMGSKIILQFSYYYPLDSSYFMLSKPSCQPFECIAHAQLTS